jgi:undecaprenyl-diphosphatase
MALTTVRPTALDVSVANEIAAHTGPRTEQAAEALTWGADEHILCALAAGWWLYARDKDKETRLASNHTTLVASALPHLLKTVFDQERPDRLTVRGHWRGIPFSGNRLDAFPSGHAVHIGALASAASILPVKQRNAVWGIGLGLVLTRIILLAHWTSDVAVGLGVGALTERILRLVTGYGRRSMAEPLHTNPLAPAMISAKAEERRARKPNCSVAAAVNRKSRRRT